MFVCGMLAIVHFGLLALVCWFVWLLRAIWFLVGGYVECLWLLGWFVLYSGLHGCLRLLVLLGLRVGMFVVLLFGVVLLWVGWGVFVWWLDSLLIGGSCAGALWLSVRCFVTCGFGYWFVLGGVGV